MVSFLFSFSFPSLYLSLISCASAAPALLMTETILDDGKESRLIQMRNAQKRLKEKRKNELETLSSEMEILKQKNEMLTKENKRYKRQINSIFGLLDNGVTPDQYKSLTSITDFKFEDEDDAYIPLHEFLDLYDYNRHRKLFDDDNTFVLKTICSKSIDCNTRTSELNKIHILFASFFKQMPKYGLSLVGNFVRDIQKVYYENLVPKCWFYPRDQIDIPPYSLSTPEIIHQIIERFDPDSMILEVLLSFITRQAFVTDYGFAIYPEDLNTCFDISRTSRFDEAYILGTVDEDACLSTYLKRIKLNQQPSEPIKINIT